MALEYKNQINFPVIGTVTYVYQADGATISTATRTSWALTTAYQSEGTTKPTKTFATTGFSKVNFDIFFTVGAGETANSIELKIEGSPDGVNFYRIPNETVSGGTSTLTAREFTFVGADATTSTISIGLDIFYHYLRISAKETGVVTNAGSAYVEATLSGV